jgi:hypothetical protein
MPALGVVVLVIGGGVLLWLAVHASRFALDQRLAGLGAARSLMDDGAAVDEGEGTVTGKLNGLDVRVCLTMATSGSNRRHLTQIDVLIGEPAFALEIRPETPLEQAHRSRGLAVDVVVGEPAFDKAFAVEAAPAAAAASLLRDTILRDRLRVLHPVSIRPCPGGVRLEIERWILERSAMRRAFETAVVLATGMEAAALNVHGLSHDASEGAGTYRGPRARATRDADLRRQEEVTALGAVKEKRRQHDRRKRLLMLTVGWLIAIGWLAWLILSR